MLNYIIIMPLPIKNEGVSLISMVYCLINYSIFTHLNEAQLYHSESIIIKEPLNFDFLSFKFMR
jgi:hypothetical protein